MSTAHKALGHSAACSVPVPAISSGQGARSAETCTAEPQIALGYSGVPDGRCMPGVPESDIVRQHQVPELEHHTS